jgi:hypothetical protein
MSNAVASETQEVVRVTIEVAGLTEVWEIPREHLSHLAAALTSIEKVAAELRARYEQAEILERQLGDGEIK